MTARLPSANLFSTLAVIGLTQMEEEYEEEIDETGQDAHYDADEDRWVESDDGDDEIDDDSEFEDDES